MCAIKVLVFFITLNGMWDYNNRLPNKMHYWLGVLTLMTELRWHPKQQQERKQQYSIRVGVAAHQVFHRLRKECLPLGQLRRRHLEPF